MFPASAIKTLIRVRGPEAQKTKRLSKGAGKFKWIRVGEASKRDYHSSTHQVGHSSFNKFDILDSLADQESLSPDINSLSHLNDNHSMSAAINDDSGIKDKIIPPSQSIKCNEDSGINDKIIPPPQTIECNEGGNFYGKKYSTRKTHKYVQTINSSLVPITPIISAERFECCQPPEEQCSEIMTLPLECTPITSCMPSDWSDDFLRSGDCGNDQQKVSNWVLNRMRTFKKTLGISSEDFDDKLMDLFQSIEERRRSQQGGERRRPKGSTKGARELKNLEWSISYNKGSQRVFQDIDEGSSRTPLPLSF